MARLNEPPIPTESIDSLKRRFLRQNRDLAKNNSAQSIRIRCLEAEISRLLADNLALREELIVLRETAADTVPKTVVMDFRDELQGQLQGLQCLLAKMNEFGGRKAPGKERRQSALYERRPRMDPLEIDGSDGRLATIREDKSYPRRTLEPHDVRRLSELAAESPDLGPPPVAHYDTEPVKYDAVPPTTLSLLESAEGQDNSVFGTAEMVNALPSNLETRRKRKEGASKIEIRRMSVFQSPEDSGVKKDAVVATVKAGAKRKLGVRDEDQQNTKNQESFAYSRRNANTGPLESEKTAALQLSKPEEKPVKTQTTRRILGEKNVNTDPIQSPVKAANAIDDAKDKLKKPQTEPSKDAAKRFARSDRKPKPSETMLHFVAMSGHSPVEEVVDVFAPQHNLDMVKSPAINLHDLLSPGSAEPLTDLKASKDTPPPSDLTPAIGGLETTGRIARRARTQVNYAEPSLTAKMRRPTKELVDAVGKDGRPISGVVSVKDESETIYKSLPPASRTGTGAALHEPGSPLSKKSGFTPSDVIVKQEEVEEPRVRYPSEEVQKSSTVRKPSRSSIAGPLGKDGADAVDIFIKTSRHVRVKSEPEFNPLEDDPASRPSLSIFDFAGSSPDPTKTTTTSASAGKRSVSDPDRSNAIGTAGRKSATGPVNRRHSSLDLTRPQPTASVSLASRNGLPANKHTDAYSAADAVVTAQVRTQTKVAAVDSAVLGAGRAERAASRRKSMMI